MLGSALIVVLSCDTIVAMYDVIGQVNFLEFPLVKGVKFDKV